MGWYDARARVQEKRKKKREAKAARKELVAARAAAKADAAMWKADDEAAAKGWYRVRIDGVDRWWSTGNGKPREDYPGFHGCSFE